MASASSDDGSEEMVNAGSVRGAKGCESMIGVGAAGATGFSDVSAMASGTQSLSAPGGVAATATGCSDAVPATATATAASPDSENATTSDDRRPCLGRTCSAPNPSGLKRAGGWVAQRRRRQHAALCAGTRPEAEIFGHDVVHAKWQGGQNAPVSVTVVPRRTSSVGASHICGRGRRWKAGHCHAKGEHH